MSAALGLRRPLSSLCGPGSTACRPAPDTAALAACRPGRLRTAGGLLPALHAAPGRRPGLRNAIWTRGEAEPAPTTGTTSSTDSSGSPFPAPRRPQRPPRPGGGGAAGRGANRDAMTHFDECGIVVAGHRPELFELIRQFRWRELFWERGGNWRVAALFRLRPCHLRAVVGALSRPHRQGRLLRGGPGWLDNPPARCRAEVDGFAASQLGRAATPPRNSSPP